MSLTYYTSHSPLTNPNPYTVLFDPLPNDPAGLIQTIHGLLIHKLAAEHYRVHLSMIQRDEQNYRTIQQRLARIVELDPAPLTTPRDPNGRQVGICRDFALMLVSMLRHKGIPARMRVGFAEYLVPDSPIKADHWITEYWNGERWVLVDPQIDDVQRTAFGITANTLDLQPDRDFYLAGSAWHLARSGKVKSTFFRFSGQWKGFPCIRGNLLHDFQALNKIELTPHDAWDELALKDERDLTVDDKTLLDQIAKLIAPVVSINSTSHDQIAPVERPMSSIGIETKRGEDTFDDLRTLFERLPRTQVIRDRLRTLGITNPYETTTPDTLHTSDASRLATLSKNGNLQPSPFNLPTEYLPYDPAPHMTQTPRDTGFGLGDIIVRGARQHNLQGIDVRIPRHKLVVVTGVSGSGKSSLAFDTIYAEGQRRYVESLSSYARQFMGQMEKPKVDQITGLSPAIAIEQKTVSKNPRSTVGTVTEILDYLRVLYARIGVPHCPQCGRAVHPQTAQQITTQLAALPPGTRFQLLAPLAKNRKGTHTNLLKQAAKDGYTRARVNGELVDLLAQQSWPDLDKNKKHHVEVIVDRLATPMLEEDNDNTGHAGTQSDALRDLDIFGGSKNEWSTRLSDSVETTLRLGNGVLIVALENEEIILSEHHACPHCDISFPELQPQMFSFNSAFGMCPDCNGLGVQLQVDPNLIIVHPELSLYEGASAWHGNIRKKSKSQWTAKHLEAIADHYGVSLETPWNDLPDHFKHVYLYGSGEEKIHFSFQTEDGGFSGESYRETKGAIANINRLFRQTKSDYTRRFYMSFMSRLPCPTCEGERLCPEARFTTVDGIRLPEMSNWSIENVHAWTGTLTQKLDMEGRKIAGELIEEIRLRLSFLRNVGLHYLTLNRPAPTLSGGEGQRIRLASQIGSGLVGVLYILDEPSIGLHTRDHRALLDTLTHLRDIGNTVLVVEHDADTMRAADWLIDLGPGPGVLGGRVVSAGTPEEVMADEDSMTGAYLRGEKTVTPPAGWRYRAATGWLTVRGARQHNLKGVDVRFPLSTLTVVTGVSGSGKSSLIAHTLFPALSRTLHNAQVTPGAHDTIEGLEQIDKVINITQDPIGRNPRSNPGTYSGVMDEIRAVFATAPEAKARGYAAGRFSMNSKGGRCEACAGYGVKKVEMHFLADVYVQCKECNGLRFNRQTLEVTYKGKTIAEVLDMDVQEALDFFGNHPKIARILQTLHDVGLDYMKLGQSALTLSGGEAQRVKLAKELSRVATGRTVYILDEPTTGLHFADIQRLLDVLHRLVDAGNTVIVIEHNLDVIRAGDWLVDLGPEGGDKGGYVVAEGTPEEVSRVEGSYTGRFLREVLEEGNRTQSVSI